MQSDQEVVFFDGRGLGQIREVRKARIVTKPDVQYTHNYVLLAKNKVIHQQDASYMLRE
jgi:hypothetical protein